MSILGWVISIAVGASAFAWFASLLTNDTSWVDRLWSIVPWVYIVVFAHGAHWHDARLNLMAALTTAWGLRLTFNFARKGGYTGVEDYRWEVLRGRMTKLQFQLFNLFFIVLYQNALLVLIALPALTAFQHPGRPLGGLDYLVGLLFVLCLAGETVADQQQWNFHQRKAAAVAAGASMEPGFLNTGLFRFSRHPNYFFEISQWWLVYAFGAVAAGSLMQWTMLGAVLLTILFIGSTRFTEEISSAKYPQYAQYQRTTSAVIPWFPRTGRRA